MPVLLSRPLALRLLIIVVWLGLLGALFARDFLVREVDLREEQIVARGR